MYFRNIMHFFAEFLRPFLMSFKEMNEQDIITANNRLDEDIKELLPAIFQVQAKQIQINYKVINSMHDGLELVTIAKEKLK